MIDRGIIRPLAASLRQSLVRKPTALPRGDAAVILIRAGVVQGGATFARASSGSTYADPQIINVVGNDIPRRGPGGGLLIEGPITNFLSDSEGVPSATAPNTVAVSSEIAARFPSNSLMKHIRDATATDENCGQWPTIRAGNYGTTFTLSRWVYVPASSTATAITYLLVIGGGGSWYGGTGTTTVSADMSKRDQWQLLSATFTTRSSGAIYPNPNMVLRITGPTGAYCYSQAGQFEQNGFATTYIPTTGSIVTRAADVTTYALSAAQQARGTLVGTFVLPGLTGTGGQPQGLILLTSGLDSNRLALRVPNGTARVDFIKVVDNGTPLTGPGNGTITLGAPARVALAWDETGISYSVNGVLTSIPAGLPSISRLAIGTAQSNAAQPMFGEVSDLVFYPTRLSDAQLQSLTL